MSSTPTCRGCGRALNGHPYHTGKAAYSPEHPGVRLPSNHYGGHVCSRRCDIRATLEMESSFPGAGKATRLSPQLQASISRKWDAYEESI